MTLVRVGLSDRKYSAGYEAIFGAKKSKKAVAKSKKPGKKPRKK